MINKKPKLEFRKKLSKNSIIIILAIASVNVFNMGYCSTMMGGPGNDNYHIDKPNNILIEYPNEGVDTVYTSVSHTLGPNFENIVLQGTTNINAIGNDLDNIIIGNVGNNVLEGKGGNDTYIYRLGGGHDTIIDDSGIDTIKFGKGITSNSIYFVRMFSDLKIYFKYKTDSSITVKKFFSGNNKIENFLFSDGQLINNIKPKLVNGWF